MKTHIMIHLTLYFYPLTQTVLNRFEFQSAKCTHAKADGPLQTDSNIYLLIAKVTKVKTY